jgi:hypothetical protein
MPPVVTLTISPDPDQPGNQLVVVNGEGFYGAAPNAQVGIRMRGDDEWFDDSLYVFEPGLPGQLLHDGSFTMSASVPSGRLNEDWGTDEVFALASVDGFGDIRSNTISRSF